MKMVNFLLVVSGVIFLTSCASSRHPVGFPLQEDLSKDLTHAWTNPEGTMHVHCDADGNLQIGAPEWDEDAGKFKMNNLSGPLLRLDDEFYLLNLREENEAEDEDEGYGFLLVKFEEDKAICWAANVSAIQELVKDGELEGEVGRYDATLTGDGEAIAKKLATMSLSEVFDWQKPTVFWRAPGK